MSNLKKLSNYQNITLKIIGLGLPGMKPIKESSEVQSIQIGDGDVMKNISLPIYMIFPRWYVCTDDYRNTCNRNLVSEL